MTSLTRQERLKENSGNKTWADEFVTFFYLLMRDHLTSGEVEALVEQVVDKPRNVEFTNGYLLNNARDIVEDLRSNSLRPLVTGLGDVLSEDKEYDAQGNEIVRPPKKNPPPLEILGNLSVDHTDYPSPANFVTKKSNVTDLEEARLVVEKMVSDGMLDYDSTSAINEDLTELFSKGDEDNNTEQETLTKVKVDYESYVKLADNLEEDVKSQDYPVKKDETGSVTLDYSNAAKGTEVEERDQDSVDIAEEEPIGSDKQNKG